MFRRRAQRLLRRIAGPRAPRMVQQANRMLAVGDHAQAALIFIELAQGAQEHFPQRAPFLYMQAGRAAILGGQVQTGIAHIRRGLVMLADQHRFSRMQILGAHILEELQGRGLHVEAQEIEGLLQGNLPDAGSPEPPAPKRNARFLPTHCPSCGAVAKPREMEWLDEHTAECAYCGSPLRAAS